MSEEVTKQTENEKSAEKPEKPTEKKKMAMWKKVLLVAVGLFVLLIAFAYFGTRGASQAGDEYITDLQSGRCGAIFSRTSDEFRADTSQDQWADACERISSILQGEAKQKNVEIASSSGNDQTAQVDYEITGTDGETYTVSFQMVNRDDVWQLTGFNSEKQ